MSFDIKRFVQGFLFYKVKFKNEQMHSNNTIYNPLSYIGNSFANLQLRSVLWDTLAGWLFSPPPLSSILVTYKYNKPISKIIMNYSKIINKLNERPNGYIFWIHHVLETDLLSHSKSYVAIVIYMIFIKMRTKYSCLHRILMHHKNHFRNYCNKCAETGWHISALITLKQFFTNYWAWADKLMNYICRFQ